MQLVNVYPPLTGIWPFRRREFDSGLLLMLYELLGERLPSESISHRGMPTWPQHVDFVRSEPYAAWYAIEAAAQYVGAVYLSKADEIGIGVFRSFQHRGYARSAILALMQRHPRQRYLANVNPSNGTSASMFRGLGFELVQHTYAKEAP